MDETKLYQWLSTLMAIIHQYEEYSWSRTQPVALNLHEEVVMHDVQAWLDNH